MPSLSIIVPHCDRAELFEDTLVSILQNRPANSEVVVVTAGEYDDPYGLAGELSILTAPATANLVEQINLGVGASRGDVIHVIQCGLTVEEGWCEPALVHFDNGEMGAVTPGIRSAPCAVVHVGVRKGRTGRRLEVLADSSNLGRSDTVRCSGPALLAGFWRKIAWERAGGLDSSLGEHYADLDLAISLHTLGYRCIVEPRSQIAMRQATRGTPGSWRDGRSAESLFWKHAVHARRGAYALHAVGLAGEFLAAIPRPRRMVEFLGRVSVLGSKVWSRTRSSEAVHTPQPAGAPSNDLVRRRDGVHLLSDRERRTAPRNAVQPY